jgi:glycosyltransferase involved in cell wall biosynthesis
VRVVLDGSPLLAARGEPLRGGVATAVLAWCAGFARALTAPDEVIVRVPAGAAIPAGLAGPRLRVEPVPVGEADPVRAARRVRATLARTAHADADVVLSPWSAFPAASVPVVATVHELPFVRWGPIEGRARSLLHRRRLAQDVRECAAIVVPSEATRADLLSLHPDAAPRVHVVPHGFDPAPWSAAARALREPAAGEARGILVGATHARKGIDVFLGALESLKDLPLSWTLVGSPGGRVARRLAAWHNVRVIDALDTPALAREIASSSLLVYPSRSEGFGYPPLEAMAAGVPVIASDAGSIPEVVGDAARLVPPGDPVALAAAVREVVLTPGLRARLVAAGAARAGAFPPEATARRLLAVLRDAAALRDPAGESP